MFLGVLIFRLGRSTYIEADELKPANPEDMSISRVFSVVILPALIAGIIGWIIPGNIFGSDSNDAFIFACLPVVYFFITLFTRANQMDKKPIGALLAIFLVSVFFWAVFKQNGTALTTWAQFYTDRQVSPALEKPLSAIYMVEKVKTSADSVVRYDNNFKVVKENGVVVKEWGDDVYLRNMNPAKIPDDGSSIHILNTELFQSINPFWVIVLTPVLVWFWSVLRRRKREPSTPVKIALGLFITALSTLCMVGAVMASQNGLVKSSPLWLVATYGVITIGELCLSPMGLSLVSKLSSTETYCLIDGRLVSGHQYRK